MKLKLKTETMVAALKRVTPILTSRTTLPILSNVLLKQREDGALTLTTGDLDKFIITTVKDVEVKGAEDGATLPGKRMLAIMDAQPGEISIDLDEKKSLAKCKTASGLYTLHGVPANEFPPIPALSKKSVSFMIDAEELREGLRALCPFISTDESRYILNGVYFERDDDRLVMVATDGRRLGRYTVQASVPALEPVVVPHATVTAIMRLLPASGKVALTFPTSGDGIMRYEDDESILMSKIIEGRFPNYKMVIPSTDDQKVNGRIECKTFMATLRRVRLMQDTNNHSVKFAFKGAKCTLSSETRDVGSSIETVDLAVGNGELTILINGDYFAAALEGCGEEAYVGLETDHSPCRLDSGAFTAVLMPLRPD